MCCIVPSLKYIFASSNNRLNTLTHNQMKTFLTSISTFALSSILTFSIASALTSESTTIYKGEIVPVFELPEIEIKAVHSLSFELPEVEIKAEKLTVQPESDFRSLRTIQTNTTLNDSLRQLNNESIAVCNLDFNMNSLIEDNELYLAERSTEIPTVPLPEESAPAKENKEYKKRPFMHFITNKVYHLGYKLFETVSDGLFFRS